MHTFYCWNCICTTFQQLKVCQPLALPDLYTHLCNTHKCKSHCRIKTQGNTRSSSRSVTGSVQLVCVLQKPGFCCDNAQQDLWYRVRGMGPDLRVNHGPPSSKVVCCGACGSGYNQPIPLHMGHKVAITEALQVAQERGHASVNHHFVENNLLVQMRVVVCSARQKD